MTTGFFSILDDLIILMNNIFFMSQKNDLTINTKKSIEFKLNRKLSIIWKIIKGSFINKIIIIPIILFISYFLSFLIIPIVILSSLYLS